MQILDIYPKDIHVNLDLTATEVKGLIEALSAARIDYDGKKNPDMQQHVAILDRFYKLLTEVQDGLSQHPAA